MIFFTSDLHGSHSNIIKYCNRPFFHVNEMKEALIANWNSKISNDDTVYCLGDFTFSLDSVFEITPRLMGAKILVPGNHDLVHHVHKKSRNPKAQDVQIENYIKAGWEDIIFNTTIELGKYKVRLCHFPYIHENCHRYPEEHPIDDGMILLHGHSHSPPKDRVHKSAKGTLQIDVGVDAWNYYPISELEIKNICMSHSV
jgi:calcineurin-like phosphoesterase family protein